MKTSQDARFAEQFLARPLVLAALVVGFLVFGLIAYALAKWRGWRRLPAVLAGGGLALALAVTLARPGVLNPGIETFHPRCVANDFALIATKQRLNFYMLMPFAFFATLATRRPIVIIALSATLSACIELTQAVVGLGVCDSQDFLNNAVGAVIAVLTAWLINGVIRMTRSSQSNEVDTVVLPIPRNSRPG